MIKSHEVILEDRERYKRKDNAKVNCMDVGCSNNRWMILAWSTTQQHTWFISSTIPMSSTNILSLLHQYYFTYHTYLYIAIFSKLSLLQ